jgi:hypothetical protein
MIQPTPRTLSALYEADETAWLEAMASLVRAGELDPADRHTLAEYLTDMAKRDKREVLSRLTVLIAHLLKWQYQPEQRTRSWSGTMVIQQQELSDLLESAVLRNHAESVLDKAYANAVRRAVAETGLAEATFSRECPYSLDKVLTASLD